MATSTVNGTIDPKGEYRHCSACFWWSDAHTSVCVNEQNGLYGRHVDAYSDCPYFARQLQLSDFLSEDDDDRK